MRMLAVLRRRHVLILWLSQVLSAVGDQLYTLAATWLAIEVAGSRGGLVAAASSATTLGCGLLGGALADRWSRRTTLLVADLLRAALVLSLPVVAQFGTIHLWHLAGVAAAVGALGALFSPALQASLPRLVDGPAALQAANSLLDLTWRLALVVGPGLAGALLTVLPLPHLFTIDAASFLVSAAAVLALGRRLGAPFPDTAAARPGLRAVIGGAARAVWAHRPLSWGIAAGGVGNLTFAAAFFVGAPLLAAGRLGGGAGVYGLLLAAYGAGGVAANLLLGGVTLRRQVAAMCAGPLVSGAGLLLLAVAPGVPAACLGAAVAAMGAPLHGIPLLVLLQTELPEGRIATAYSLRMTVSGVGAALGLVLAAPLFAVASAPVGIAAGAAVNLAVGAAGLARFGLADPGSDRRGRPVPTAD